MPWLAATSLIVPSFVVDQRRPFEPPAIPRSDDRAVGETLLPRIGRAVRFTVIALGGLLAMAPSELPVAPFSQAPTPLAWHRP